jgi:ribonuclease VapC
MIIDSSAIIAILRREVDEELYADAIARTSTKRLSAATYVESSIVALQRGVPALRLLDGLIESEKIEIVAFSATHARLARAAYASYGRTFHRAGLNFGDCMSYALAKDLGEPLLYKGEDFAHTDIVSALPLR